MLLLSCFPLFAPCSLVKLFFSLLHLSCHFWSKIRCRIWRRQRLPPSYHFSYSSHRCHATACLLNRQALQFFSLAQGLGWRQCPFFVWGESPPSRATFFRVSTLAQVTPTLNSIVRYERQQTPVTTDTCQLQWHLRNLIQRLNYARITHFIFLISLRSIWICEMRMLTVSFKSDTCFVSSASCEPLSTVVTAGVFFLAGHWYGVTESNSH